MEIKNDIPIVVHIIYKLDIGGLETVLVEFINRCPRETYRHIILCLTDFTSFKDRINNPDVEVVALHKQSGKDLKIFFKVLSFLRAVNPKIVHTYNLASLEYQLAAFICGIPLRIHAEHGRDISDIYGENKKYILLRRVMNLVLHHWVPVSKELALWLVEKVKISEKKIRLIHNGVDTKTFQPSFLQTHSPIEQVLPKKSNSFTIGSIGRLDGVKDHQNLIMAFSLLLEKVKHDDIVLKLQIVGEGPERNRLEAVIARHHLEKSVDLAGAKNNISEVLHAMDIFVLPSKAEGIPMTVLEACASGLPIVATDVGGLNEIITENKNGFLVEPGEPDELAKAIGNYLTNAELISAHGLCGRKHIVENFSLDKMTNSYLALYDGH